MSTIEDFENAPVGATATHKATGNRAMRVPRTEMRWFLSSGIYTDDESMARWGYTLDPATPTSAREALDLAWELAHPVKEGQVIPEGTNLLDRLDRNDFSVYTTLVGFTISGQESLNIRTLEPLPDPEPEWLDAPAVLARLDDMTRWDLDERQVFTPASEEDDHWVAMFSALTYHWSALTYHWSELRDVTPLYPKETNK